MSAAMPTPRSDLPELDLVVDLNSEDESGLLWTHLDEARHLELVREGAWLIVGEGNVRAVARLSRSTVTSSECARFRGRSASITSFSAAESRRSPPNAALNAAERWSVD
jgi:hypothetical protein